MGRRKRKHSDMSKGKSAEADVEVEGQRDEGMQPCHLSSIKETISLLLHRSTARAGELFSHLCGQLMFASRNSNPAARVALPLPNPHQANQSYRVLRLDLLSLFGLFDVLCNHTNVERSSSRENLHDETVEMLKETIQQLEAKVDAKSLAVEKLEQHHECQLAAWETERKNSARFIQNHQAELTRLAQRAAAFEEQCKVLQGKLERAEMLQAQKSLVDSGSYEESGATPPLLQTAADSVKDAIAMFASDFFCIIKKHSISLRTSALGLINDDAHTVPRSGYIRKVALQALVCHTLFRGFEDPYFFMDCRSWPLFEKPEIYRQCMFQSYKKLRDCKPEQMGAQFKGFFNARVPALCDHMSTLLFKSNLEPNELYNFVVFEVVKRRDSPVRVSLLRLLKALWLLQKLAFALEPNAQIFRIAQSSKFDEEFMEDIAPVDECECVNGHNDDSGSLEGVKKVKFMCVPGFIVRHTVIKARVVCLEDY